MYMSVPIFRIKSNAASYEECKVHERSLYSAISLRQLNRAGSTHRAWQELPRHLRRRAASHHVRRVPLRIRQKSRAEVSSDSVYTRTIFPLTNILGDGSFTSKNAWEIASEARKG
jgi:Ribonucleases P/MRP protein subunit POP1